MIQGIKAARLTASAYGAVDGFAGGSKVTLAAAGDALDPAKLEKFALMPGDVATAIQAQNSAGSASE